MGGEGDLVEPVGMANLGGREDRQKGAVFQLLERQEPAEPFAERTKVLSIALWFSEHSYFSLGEGNPRTKTQRSQPGDENPSRKITGRVEQTLRCEEAPERSVDEKASTHTCAM